jgi:N-glycosylase/DNA lyase
MEISALLERHRHSRQQIGKRLLEFREFSSKQVMWTYEQDEIKLVPSSCKHDERLFEELAFCILAANTSAEMGMKTVDRLRKMLHHASPKQMTTAIKGVYRFINLRPQYIVHSRTYLQQLDVPFHELLRSFEDKQELRDFLANNAGIKGIGYKEASHFLRNVGIGGFAILDKHIVKSMHEFGITPTSKPPSSRRQYLELEQRYVEWAESLGISPEELDLLLWSRKTGKILK